MKQNTTQDERGLVSIIITVILMIVISITVLSFAQIIRREQREALDNQLSTQAFYAAESGVNDARNWIQTRYTATNTVIPDKTNCNSDAAGSTDYPQDKLPMTISENVKYTCLLVDATPDNLTYQDVTASGRSKVIPIKTANGAVIDRMTLSWKKADTQPLTECPDNAVSEDLKKTDDYKCPYGMLRFDLVPIASSGSTSRSSLASSTFTAFVGAQRNTVSEVSYNTGTGLAGQGIRTGAYCNDSTCSITISGLSSSRFYARASAMYKDTKDFKITATSAGSSVEFRDTQIVIDSTGKAQDVLRRIQVRVPLVKESVHADYSILSNTSICKLITTPTSTPDGECAVPASP